MTTWILRTSGYDIQVHAYPAATYATGEHAYWEAACHHTTPTKLLAETDEITPTCFACLLPFGKSEYEKLAVHVASLHAQRGDA